MRDHVKFGNGSARTYHHVVGPKHDPYGRQITEVCIDHQPTVLIITCDLEGNVCQIGELHVGVDDDAGSYQILDNNGDGLVELTFFRKG